VYKLYLAITLSLSLLVTAVPAQPVVDRTAPTARGLLGWWRVMPGVSGGPFWYSLMGPARGTLVNMTAGLGWASTTRPGGQGEMRFNGTNTRVTFPANAALEPPEFTITLWVKVGSLGVDYSMLWGLNAGGGLVREVMLDTSGRLAVYLQTSAGLLSFDPAATALALGVWTHVAVSYSQADGLRGFVNCTSDATTASTGTMAVTNSAGAFGMNPNSLNRFFAGAMDDVRLYNRVVPRAALCTMMRDAQRGEPTLLRPPALVLGLPGTPSASGGGGRFFPFFGTQ